MFMSYTVANPLCDQIMYILSHTGARPLFQEEQADDVHQQQQSHAVRLTLSHFHASTVAKWY